MALKLKQIEAIELLAEYKYLTSSLFVKLGLYKHKGDVTNVLKELSKMKKPLLKVIEFNFGSKIGRQESFYCLTNYGKKFLIEKLEYIDEQIKLPSRGSTNFEHDYIHRKFTIDFHIGLNQHLKSNNGEIDFLHYYFDKDGNNRTKTSAQHIKGLNRLTLKDGNSFIPDIITKFRLEDEEYLFVFEQHNGKNTKKLINQIHNHTLALLEKTASIKYKFSKRARVVIVFEHESIKNATIKKLHTIKSLEQFHNFFIFKTNDELKEDFFTNWTLINGNKVNFTKK